MRVPTSIYAVESALGDFYATISEAYAKESGRALESGKLGWHWVLTENECSAPKSSSVMLKNDPQQYLSIGISRKRYALRLSIKPESGRVWLSDILPGRVVPKEVALAMQRRAAPVVGSKWAGAAVDIYMPMHQKHPGLAEHAIVGAIRTETGEVVCFLSDRPDPMQAPIWQAYALHPDKKVAQALLSIVDREGQRDFRSTYPGQELSLKNFKGERLCDEQIAEALGGVKKFTWKTDSDSSQAPIPQNARRFKLGEELGADECRSIPMDVFIGALDALSSK